MSFRLDGMIRNHTRYTDSTMQGWTKVRLLEYIRALEHNIDSLEEKNGNQFVKLCQTDIERSQKAHARWNLKRDKNTPTLPLTIFCSSCKECVDAMYFKEYKFCPHCGAKMCKEERNNDKE